MAAVGEGIGGVIGARNSWLANPARKL